MTEQDTPTEQNIPTETTIAGAPLMPPTTPKVEKPKQVQKPKTTPAKVTKKGKTTKPKSDEQKRLAKNAAVRDWRKKNKDRFAAYMNAWRENKKKKQAKPKTPRAPEKGGTRE